MTKMNISNNKKSTEIKVFDIKDIIDSIKLNIMFITFFSLLISCLSYFYAISLPNIYKSETVLLSFEDSSQDSISSLASQFSGIANLAGVNVGGGAAKTNKTLEGIEVLKSTKFLSNYILDRDIELPIFAALPDKGNKSFTIDPKKYDIANKGWVIEKPSVLSLVRSFKANNFTVFHDIKTGFVKISITHYSPELAKNMAEWIVIDLNAYFKNKHLEEARKTVEYLEKEIASNSIKPLEVIFYKLIEEQTKKIMLANTRDEYFFRTIDPPVIADIKFSPRRSVILILGTAFGGLVSLLIAFLAHFNNRSIKLDILPPKIYLVKTL